jgi:GNAT superfamily N-acetyltransferase
VKTVPSPRIRRARRTDARALTAIAHAAKRDWGYGDDLMGLWKRDLTLRPEQVDADPVFCAVRGAELVGFYALSRDGGDVELEHLWVHPRRMGAGVGARLFGHALRRARALGGRRLRIASDPNAEGFYRRMGAHRVGRVASRPAGRTLPVLVVPLRSGGRR